MKMKVYEKIAQLVNAVKNCDAKKDNLWASKHEDDIKFIVRRYLPSGSGIDNGVKFDFAHSTDEKLVFNSSFHKMDENGFYDGWIDFIVVVKPSLQFGISLTVTGQFGKRQDIKDMIHHVFNDSLETVISERED